MPRSLPWLFCLTSLLLAAPLLRLLAQPRSLESTPDLVYLAQLFDVLIASAGLAGLLIAFLIRLAGRTLVALALLVPALGLCAWHLSHTQLGPVSPSAQQYQLLLASLAIYTLALTGISWLNRRTSGARKALRLLGLALLLPWALWLFYLARLYY